MTNDLFARIRNDKGPLGKWASVAEGYFAFPKLEGEIGNRMYFQGKEVITWSVNDYLGLANHPEVRKVDADAAAEHGSAYPMGARLMSGHTSFHEQLQDELAEVVGKEAAYVLNFGYQGILSTIDTLVSKNDVIVYDVDSHACIVDGVRLHMGKRFTFRHNDIESLEKIYNVPRVLPTKQVVVFWLFLKVYLVCVANKDVCVKLLRSKKNTDSAFWLMMRTASERLVLLALGQVRSKASWTILMFTLPHLPSLWQAQGRLSLVTRKSLTL